MPTKTRRLSRSLALAALLCLACTWADPAHADCFDEAGAYQHVNSMVLRAIAWLESHNRPDAMHRNANGSIDYGVMQINSIHLRELDRYHISRATLMRPCANVYVGAWHLRRMMNKYGNTWTAVGAYHSETPAERDQYARRIEHILAKWRLSVFSHTAGEADGMRMSRVSIAADDDAPDSGPDSGPAAPGWPDVKGIVVWALQHFGAYMARTAIFHLQ